MHINLIETHIVIDVTLDGCEEDNIIKSGSGFLEVHAGDIIQIERRRYRVLKGAIKQRSEQDFWLKTQFVHVEPATRLAWLTRVWENLFKRPNLLVSNARQSRRIKASSKSTSPNNQN